MMSLQPPGQFLAGLATGLSGGVLSGLFGIGGGVIMIPLLAPWVRLPQLQAQLVSLVVMIPPIRLPGVMVYAHGKSAILWLIIGGLAAGFSLGTYWGARLATHIPAHCLKKAFAGLMLITAGPMLWRA